MVTVSHMAGSPGSTPATYGQVGLRSFSQRRGGEDSAGGLLVVAGHLGPVRLIDNLELGVDPLPVTG